MATVKFSKDEMLELLDDDGMVVRNRITGTGRWTINHEIIFRRDAKLYKANYRVGATESQDEGPWEHLDEVECTEVKEVQVTITDYEPA